MEEKNSCGDECMALPEEIEASLSRCGGIRGLTARLPGDAGIEAECTVHRALADPLRMKTLSMLAIQPLCVCVIKDVLGIADSKLSYHLSVLKRAGLIRGEQQGNWIIYHLTDEGGRWVPPRT